MSTDAILTQILTQLQALQVSQQTLQAKVSSKELYEKAAWEGANDAMTFAGRCLDQQGCCEPTWKPTGVPSSQWYPSIQCPASCRVRLVV